MTRQELDTPEESKLNLRKHLRLYKEEASREKEEDPLGLRPKAIRHMILAEKYLSNYMRHKEFNKQPLVYICIHISLYSNNIK